MHLLSKQEEAWRIVMYILLGYRYYKGGMIWE